MDQPTDAALIAASRHDPERFAQIFDRHFDVVHGYLARRVERERAAELASETFVAAFDGRGRFDEGRSGARPWLLGIATNLLRHHRRSEVRRIHALARLEPGGAEDGGLDALPGRLDAAAMRGSLLGAVAELAAGDRDVLLLHAWADLSYAEIAEALGIPIGTVRSRLHRVRAKLRERIGAGGQVMDATALPPEVVCDG